MKRGTTDPLKITIKNIDLSDAEWVVVSVRPTSISTRKFTGGSIDFDREHMSLTSDGTDTVIIIQFTQKQSLRLGTDAIQIDINWGFDGQRQGSKFVVVDMDDTLLDREVHA